MISVVPFIKSHFDGLVLTKWQGDVKDNLGDAYAELLLEGHAYSFIKDGEVIAICGTFQLTKNRFHVWALMTENSGRYMLKITRETKRFFEEKFKGKRIETPVLREFPQGHRWAKMLGFTNETPCGMLGYGDNGETYDLYARVV